MTLSNASLNCFTSPLSLSCLKEGAINAGGFIAGAALPIILSEIACRIFRKSQSSDRLEANIHVTVLALGAIGYLVKMPSSLLAGYFVMNNFGSSLQPMFDRFPRFPKLEKIALELPSKMVLVKCGKKRFHFPDSQINPLCKIVYASFLLGLAAYTASYALASPTAKIINLTSYAISNATAYSISLIAGYYFEKKYVW